MKEFVRWFRNQLSREATGSLTADGPATVAAAVVPAVVVALSAATGVVGADGHKARTS